MRNRRIKVIWGASDVIVGQWYFGLFGFYDKQSGLAISVRGILIWGLAMAATAYVAGALALGYFWQRNPYNRLTYVDALFYPFRRSSIVVKKGEAFIAEGQDMLKAKKWFDGARLLRHGLVLAPEDLDARQELARFNVMASQRPQAVKILREGLGARFPGRDYLTLLFDLAQEGDDFDFVVETADRYLPLMIGDAAAGDRRWLTGRKFGALLAGERKPEALAFAMADEPGELASEHRVLALVELSKFAEAQEYLNRWNQRPGADRSAVRRLEVRVAREAQQPALMDRALEEMRAEAPMDPVQAVYGVVQRAMAGRGAAANTALTDFLFRFGGTAANVLMAAEPLAEIGQRELFDRCFSAAKEQGFRLQPFRAQQVQLLVRRGEWADAIAVLDLMKAAPGQTLPVIEQFWWNWMNLLVTAAAIGTDTAQLSLVEFIRERYVPMKLCRFSIDALRRAGRVEAARDVIAVTGRSYPTSRWVQVQQAEVEKEFRAMRAPREVNAPSRVVSVEVFFEKLDALLGERKWVEAGALVNSVRGQNPPIAWVERRDADLLWAQVRIHHGQSELPGMVASARLYLNGDMVRSQRLLAFARETYEAGDKSAATSLVQAVLQRSPEFTAAQQLQAQWQNAKSLGK